MSKKERIVKQAERFAKEKIGKGTTDKHRDRIVRSSVSRAGDVINLGDKLKGILIGIFMIAIVIAGIIAGAKFFIKKICPHPFVDSETVHYSYDYKTVSYRCALCKEGVDIRCDDIKVTVITPATCYSEGTQEEVWVVPGKPSLNTTRIGTIKSKFHNGDKLIERGYPATCDKTGRLDTTQCTLCGTILGGDVIEMLPHTEYVRGGYSPTCLKDGETSATVCRDCGKTIEAAEIIPMIPHDYVEHKTEATYTTSGYVYYICSGCEGHDTEREYSIPPGFATDANYAHMTQSQPGYILVSNTKPGVSELVIPESIDGIQITELGNVFGFSSDTLRRIVIPKTVTKIRDDAFSKCTALEEVVILGDEVELGYRVFKGCKNLRSVDIRGKVNIPFESFYGCTALSDMKIGDGTLSIGNYAFYGCTSLNTIKLPASMSEVSQNAFDGCKSLVEIYDVNEKFSASYPKSVISVHTSLTAPSRIFTDNSNTYISDSDGKYYMLCYGGSGNDVILPDSVRGNPYSLTVGVLSDKGEITSLKLNAVFESHLGYLFGEKQSGASIAANVPKTLTNITLDTVLTIPVGYLSGISSLTSVTLTEKTKNYTSVLGGANNLQYLELPIASDAIFGTIFGNSHYEDQKNTVPKTLTEVSISAGESIPWRYFYGLTGLTDVHLGNTVKKIGAYAFFGCTGLKKFVLPESLTEIEGYAFDGCTNLIELYNLSKIEIVVGEKSKNGRLGEYIKCVYKSLNESSSIVNIGDYQFISYGQSTAYLVNYSGTDTTLVLPDGPNGNSYIITSEVFKSNTNIKSVTIPASLATIEENTFFGCTSLEEIIFLGDITSIPTSAFSGCEKLLSVSLLSAPSLKTIGEQAFYRCYNLERVELHQNITLSSIGSEAFYYCSKLVNINYGSSIEEIGNYAFYMCNSLKSINLGTVITEIPDYLCSRCESLESISLREGITKVGASAFEKCYSLKSLEISGSISEIKASAFSGCSGLTEISFRNGLTTIGQNAFSSCTKLTRITLPESLKDIGSFAFNGCSSLEELYIPASIDNVYQYAFGNCQKLTNVTMPVLKNDINYVFNLNNSSIKAPLTEITLIGTNALDHEFFVSAQINQTKLTVSKSITKIELKWIRVNADLYFEGSEEEWRTITSGNIPSAYSVTIHYST